jgi:hypothetical protein
MQIIYAAFKEGDPDCIVTNGIGTGFDPYFNIEAISKSCDFMSVHSYPFFHGTSRLDPELGQRTLYSGNFITEWAAMVHKPVLMQENGTARPGTDAARGLRIYYFSNWAEGAMGYFWWGSHMVNRTFKLNTTGLRKEFSGNGMKNGELGADKNMGLLSVDNTPVATGSEYKECTKWIDQLGVGWKDMLPVCYILVPHTTEFYNTMLKFITPFVLAKQAHFDVKILWEDKQIPQDASAVVIACFQLSPEGKENITKYLKKGGIVYQSNYNDLSSDISVSDKPAVLVDSLKLDTPELKGSNNKNFLRVNKVEVRNLSSNESKVTPLGTSINQSDPKNVFVKTRVGKGTYYFVAANIEESLGKSKNPWLNDDSWMFYQALRPATDFRIDNKYVEIYYKKRNKEEILVLLNHENSAQNLSLHSAKEVSLSDVIKDKELAKATDFSFQLQPAEVLILKITR